MHSIFPANLLNRVERKPFSYINLLLKKVLHYMMFVACVGIVSSRVAFRSFTLAPTLAQ